MNWMNIFYDGMTDDERECGRKERWKERWKAGWKDEWMYMTSSWESFLPFHYLPPSSNPFSRRRRRRCPTIHHYRRHLPAPGPGSSPNSFFLSQDEHIYHLPFFLLLVGALQHTRSMRDIFPHANVHEERQE